MIVKNVPVAGGVVDLSRLPANLPLGVDGDHVLVPLPW